MVKLWRLIVPFNARMDIRHAAEDFGTRWHNFWRLLPHGLHPACSECGSKESLMECRLSPGRPPQEWLCPDHIEGSGYCLGCGLFSAGIESFDFGAYRGFCDNCADELRYNDQWDSEDEYWDDWYEYPMDYTAPDDYDGPIPEDLT